jgi:hypothetical protein
VFTVQPSYVVFFALPRGNYGQPYRESTFLIHGDDALDSFTKTLRDNGIKTYRVDEYVPEKHNASLML